MQHPHLPHIYVAILTTVLRQIIVYKTNQNEYTNEKSNTSVLLMFPVEFWARRLLPFYENLPSTANFVISVVAAMATAGVDAPLADNFLVATHVPCRVIERIAAALQRPPSLLEDPGTARVGLYVVGLNTATSRIGRLWDNDALATHRIGNQDGCRTTFCDRLCEKLYSYR